MSNGDVLTILLGIALTGAACFFCGAEYQKQIPLEVPVELVEACLGKRVPYRMEVSKGALVCDSGVDNQGYPLGVYTYRWSD